MPFATLCTLAHADLYGVSGSQLLRINPTSAQTTPVATLPVTDIISLTYDGPNDRLLGWSLRTVLAIDPDTGESTVVRSWAPSVAAANFVCGIEFNPSDNTLYGITTLIGRNPPSVFSINLNNGSLGGTFSQNPGIFPEAIVYASSRPSFIASDESGAVLSLFSTPPFSVTLTNAVGSMAFDPDQNRIYATYLNPANQLLAINLPAGTLSVIGPLGRNVQGLAFVPPRVAACPADLTGDSFIDDADFVLFARQYAAFACNDPTMTDACSADLNADGFVDDGDFVVFSQAYEQFACP